MRISPPVATHDMHSNPAVGIVLSRAMLIKRESWCPGWSKSLPLLVYLNVPSKGWQRRFVAMIMLLEIQLWQEQFHLELNMRNFVAKK